MDNYENNIKNLKSSEMTDIEYGNDYIKGRVKTDENKILQITAPYSKGWKAFVDKKEQEIIKVNEAFIGTVIEAGEHEVEFIYTSPYFTLGIICTSLGTLAFIIIVVIEVRKKNVLNIISKRLI